ncbi:MAG: AAA family ATPase [Clostridia bacterium]|nr:AAA family ATPase [Clostridia bacterium]
MRIKKINVEAFGKLQGEELLPGSGINVLSAPNESGKSTLLHFIKYMLWGMKGRNFEKSDVSEREYFTPWQGGTPSGALEIVSAKGDWRIERRLMSTDRRTVTNDLGEVKLAQEVGQLLFDMDFDHYRRIAVVRQNAVEIENDTNFERYLQNLLAGEDETADLFAAIKNLEPQQVKYQHKKGNGGLIFELQQQKDLLEKKMLESMEVRRASFDKERQLREYESQLAEIKEQYSQARNLEAQARAAEAAKQIRQIEDARRASSEASEAVSAVEKELLLDREQTVRFRALLQSYDKILTRETEAQQQLGQVQYPFPDSIRQEAEQLQLLLQKAELLQQSTGGATRIGALAVLAVGVISAVLGALVLPWCWLGTILLPAGLVWLWESNGNKKARRFCRQHGFADVQELSGKALLAQRQRNELLECVNSREALQLHMTRLQDERLELERQAALLYRGQTAAFDYEEAEAFCRRCEEQLAEWQKKREVAGRARAVLEALCVDKDEEQLRLLASSYRGGAFEERDKYSFKTDECLQRQQDLQNRIRQTEVELARLSSAFDPPAEVQAKINENADALEEAREKYDALRLAVETLEAVGEELSRDLYPSLSQRAGALLEKITGQYGRLNIGKEFSLRFGTEASTHSVSRFSGGTRDAAFLAVRLALCRELFGAELPVLVFDEAFARMDNERLKNTLRQLHELAKDFQILIFSCQDREEAFLKEMALPYTALSFKKQ